jgi:hypothetical protein
MSRHGCGKGKFSFIPAQIINVTPFLIGKSFFSAKARHDLKKIYKPLPTPFLVRTCTGIGVTI